MDEYIQFSAKTKNEANIPELCKMNKKEEEKDFCKN